ncbi:MAG: Rpn family recombination-promoting nuclease/putative transposase [Lachnospiraceae bacterium]|nr:Rpn family recombination-promoting nuclease/putative transposase [Lachnospiraceae bacterium]
MRKKFEELDLLDNFLMNAVASDPNVGEDACRIIVATLLQREVGKIKVVAQREIPPVSPEKRGIRLDVEVEEDTDDIPDMNIYDIEPHRTPRVPENLPRRTRFYQAKIDSRRLKRGEKRFQKLPNLYIINILDYDPFGYDQMCYTIRNKCEEVPGLEYDDGLKIMYFNIKGVKGGNDAIHNLLKFMLNSKAENVVDDTTRKMYDYVNLVKEQSEARDRYMTWDEFYDLDIAEAREAGEITKLLKLLCKKLAKGKDLEQIADDLEEDVDTIKPLYDVAVKFSPDYDVEKIFEEYKKY